MIVDCLVFIIGILIGSFLNVCIYRLPRNQSIISPPSHCPACNQRLNPLDLIPIMSYLFSLGRCRYCGKKISFQYLLIELITGLAFLLVYWQLGLNLRAYLIFLFSSALIVIAGIDAKHRMIPDKINIPGLVIGLIAATFAINIPLKDALLGILVGAGLFLIIAILSHGGMGGGDIKLMGFVGSILGWQGALLTIFLSSVIGSIFGIYLVSQKKANRKTAIPYGPFLAFGAFITALYGNQILLYYFNLFLH